MDFHTILNQLNALAQLVPWDAVVWAPVVSPVLLLIKKIKSIDNGEVMIWLLIGFSGASAVVEYMLTTPNNDPAIVAVKGFVTLIATQPVYRLLIKPALAFFAKEVEKAAALNELKTAAVAAPGGTTFTTGSGNTGTPLNPVTTQNMVR